jgi:hypothetical protein
MCNELSSKIKCKRQSGEGKKDDVCMQKVQGEHDRWDVNIIEKSVTIGGVVELDKVKKNYATWGMLDVNGGVNSTVTTRFRCAWCKFKELRPFLAAKGVSLRMKGKVYESYVRSCITNGS